MTINLEPCPFCGGEAQLSAFLLNKKLIVSAYCTSCGAEIRTHESIDDAVNNWNSRVFTKEVEESIHELGSGRPEE